MERRQNEKWDRPKTPTAPKESAGAKPKPNFSGEYALDLKSSTLEGGAASARDAVLRIDHHEPMVRIDAKFVFFDKTFAWTMHRQCDSRELTDPSDPRAVSSLGWDDDALLFVYRADVTMRWRYEIEDSGRRLKASEQIRGEGRDQDNVWIFNRR
jgi:hypothetical protein